MTAVSGTFSLGFSTNVFPHASASREHPQRHHRGKIERRDADAHAERLQHRLAIHAARDVLQRVAHEQRRHAAGVFDILHAAKNAAARLDQRLAVLARNARADAIEVLLDQLPVAEEQPRAFDRRRVAPRGKRRVRGLDRVVHRVGAAQRHFGDDLAGGRIEDRRSADAVTACAIRRR